MNKVLNEEKICNICGIKKSVDDFYKVTTNKGYTIPREKCKICYRKKSKELKKKYRTNPEVKKKEKEYSKDRYKKLKEQGYKRIRTEEYKDWERKYTKKKYESPKGLIEHRLRARISSLIRNANLRKGRKTLDYLGCSSDEFIKHLESLFLEGMSWENKNQWHIDHVKPCCSFDLTKEEEILKCFHFSNMRPLWSQDNLNKIKEDLKIKYNG